VPERIDRRAASGNRRHPIRLQAPGPAVPDGDGAYTSGPDVDLTPAMVWAAIVPATARDLERLAAGTTLAQATHILRFPHHPGVTTETKITFGTRTFSVVGVENPSERNVETIALCTEVVA
jgi:head-tail adaptor